MEKRKILKTAVVGASKAVLIALFVGLTVAAPGGVGGTLKVLNDIFGRDEEIPDYKKEQIRNALKYLKSRKLIDIQRQYQKEVFSLTKIGWLKARKLARSFGIPKPKKWDGKWRIIIFDVPEIKKEKREVFRECIKNLGLANVQKSIWIYPYECRDQIFYLAGQIFIKPYVRYIVAEKITGERDLRHRFGV